MTGEPITPERIDELLRFLPLLDHPERSFVKEWAIGANAKSGTLRFPYPEYPEDVMEFFACAGQSWWCDYSYCPAEAGKMLADDELVRRATLQDVRTMLTYCVRGERFCDGHWESMLREGRVVAILRRLAEIRKSEEFRS